MAVKLTTQAYCKMLLHAAKYPHCAVNGLLVAERQKRKDGQPVLCVDCIPLFHGTLALAPMLEVALTLIDTWCKENKYIIAGYYQANERMKEIRPNQVAEKVAARIAENFNEAALIMVDNNKFTMDCCEPILTVFEHHDNKWKCRETNVDCCEDWLEAQKITSALLESRSYDNLTDFDNHLDDLRNDWTNPEINKAVLHLC
ncbi:ER membrane protein complex subunit 8 [Amia ocellicauda]|uniref:ER membrane protein complex subunit 8 n=1 Tax=Amia ocellicauda TaxID=2972642 RepID=UPI003463B313